MKKKGIENLKDFAGQRKIVLKQQKEIVEEARRSVTKKYGYSPDKIKENFDTLLYETEKEAYRLYLEYEKKYGAQVFDAFIDYLQKEGEISDLNQVGVVLGKYFGLLDKFFLSLAQSRKTRAGKGFENIHNSLFKALEYPFDEQAVINGKPDFVMPSVAYYRENALGCVIFTAKRTLRERWRQIVTEGTRGIGFYLATIDDKISKAQLKEMRDHRIYIVCPEKLKKERYADDVNVLDFQTFFEDHLDPKMKVWKREKII